MKPRMLPVAPDGCLYYRNIEGQWWVAVGVGNAWGPTWALVDYVVERKHDNRRRAPNRARTALEARAAAAEHRAGRALALEPPRFP